MSPRVRTAFRPLETTSSFESHEGVGLRRAATSVPSLSSYSGSPSDPYAQERLQLLSRLEQRWCPSQASVTLTQRGNCFAPVPRRNHLSSSPSSRPTSSSSLVEDDLASVELRGILGSFDSAPSPNSRSSSASSMSFMPIDHEMDLFPLEEIVVRKASPITRSGNPMPLNASFGSEF
ncbi:hypothetical protein IWW50_004674 [Coemansia erecta]|nr:hypothetical protein IWW50_004674 [Coemansia erecta]